MLGKNVYEERIAISEEKGRLLGFQYPLTVSTSIISAYCIKDKKMIDIGAGPNPSLGRWVREKDGLYFACDISREFLSSQISAGNGSCCICSAEKLPFHSHTFDMGHIRFLLIHINSAKKRRLVIEEITTRCKNSIFMEFDWSTFECGPVVNNFVELTLEIMGEIADFNIGSKLESEISEVTEVKRVARFSRPLGDYYHEILPLTKSLATTVAKLRPDLKAKVSEMIEDLLEESQKENPELFIPPDIVTVIS